VADAEGYTNVWDYRGGIAEWAEAGLPVEGERANV
jgi:rhodanese-related sulfurtransferase